MQLNGIGPLTANLIQSWIQLHYKMVTSKIKNEKNVLKIAKEINLDENLRHLDKCS